MGISGAWQTSPPPLPSPPVHLESITADCTQAAPLPADPNHRAPERANIIRHRAGSTWRGTHAPAPTRGLLSASTRQQHNLHSGSQQTPLVGQMTGGRPLT